MRPMPTMTMPTMRSVVEGMESRKARGTAFFTDSTVYANAAMPIALIRIPMIFMSFLQGERERFLFKCFLQSVFKVDYFILDMRGYDILGNLALVKFPRGTSALQKKREAKQVLDTHKSVLTVVEKVDKFRGRLRTQTTKHLAGMKTKEVLYRENGCVFRFNVDTCYFSPRLAAERQDVAQMVKKGESVLVMFGGVAPFAIVIAKQGKAERVVSVELSRACKVYALENVKRNKVENVVEVVQGDVRKVVPKLNEKFDRIVMARPNLKDSFLDVAFKAVKKGGIIQYYGFYGEDEVDVMKEMIKNEAKKKIKIFGVKKAGDIGVRKFRWRVDLKVG